MAGGSEVAAVMALILGFLCLFSSVAPLLAREEAVVFVVDPSWDCVESYVANVPLLQDYKIVKVMTHLGTPPPCKSDRAVDIYRNITYGSRTPDDTRAAAEICPMLQGLGMPVAAVLATFDPAVYLADQLAACLGVRGNPSDGPLATARRDKYVMGEAVRGAGLRAAKAKLVTTWGEAEEYLRSMSPPLSRTNPVMFKILEGSSSVGVNKVESLEQAEGIFGGEFGTTSYWGGKIGKVMIQEFLQGEEYVIDSASRDGVHKTVVVWNERLNGVFLDYKAMDPEDPKIRAIIDYAHKVLTATGLRNGASDMEVFWLEEEGRPCVVDLNARWTALMWHDGLALERHMAGSDQITATANAYLDGDAFDAMPPVPSVRQFGALIFTMPRQTGVIRGIPGMGVAEKLPSYWGSFNEGMSAGVVVESIKATSPQLLVMLASTSKAAVDEDYDRIVALEDSGAFYDIAPPAGYALPALRPAGGGLPGRRLPAMAAVAMLTAAAVTAFAAAASRRNVRDGTEYLAIDGDAGH